MSDQSSFKIARWFELLDTAHLEAASEQSPLQTLDRTLELLAAWIELETGQSDERIARLQRRARESGEEDINVFIDQIVALTAEISGQFIVDQTAPTRHDVSATLIWLLKKVEDMFWTAYLLATDTIIEESEKLESKATKNSQITFAITALKYIKVAAIVARVSPKAVFVLIREAEKELGELKKRLHDDEVRSIIAHPLSQNAVCNLIGDDLYQYFIESGRDISQLLDGTGYAANVNFVDKAWVRTPDLAFPLPGHLEGWAVYSVEDRPGDVTWPVRVIHICKVEDVPESHTLHSEGPLQFSTRHMV